MRDELIAIAAKLFDEGKVDTFLGYGRGTVKFKTTPLIARRKEDLEGLWVGDFCSYNLVFYLKEIKGRVGMVVKGCDSRSLVSMLKEGQVRREDLYVIGFPCPGEIDPEKVAAAFSCQPEDLEEIRSQGGDVLARADGEEKKVPRTRVLREKCLACEYPKPVVYDTLLNGEYAAPLAGGGTEAAADGLRDKTPEEKWAFWSAQFDRCIRCYACRNICPACICPRCIVEETRPQWVSPLPTHADNFVFHLMRMMHVAGTCVSCGECERICPMDIPLTKLTRKMGDDLKELFDFSAGADLEKPLPFRSWRPEDRDEFIK